MGSPQITEFTPMFHEMKTSLYNARNTSYPPAPRNVDDVIIKGIWSKTLNESLKQLSESDHGHLFFDGTFKSCPNPFYQLYSVHSFATIDFEQAAINSIKLVFPNTIVKGCNFHFNKCIYTKLQELGFQSAFIDKKSSDMNEINVRNLYKKTCALAFMPPQEISNLWVLIMDEYQDIDNIGEFYDYVTNTWIDNDPLFDYTLWNYFDFKSLRTSNNLEGWHPRLNNDLHVVEVD
ncbi:unnamed protein product [Rotaria magnacalcarata]|uniref:MULE transposase domain-containing protein n=1 Tax=Rotaria magnacalcarata TaxID=392030 RepID=A0A820RDE2_9BILA|nr:unnamed protein product [Rotaria magnacalcarata]